MVFPRGVPHGPGLSRSGASKFRLKSKSAATKAMSRSGSKAVQAPSAPTVRTSWAETSRGVHEGLMMLMLPMDWGFQFQAVMMGTIRSPQQKL